MANRGGETGELFEAAQAAERAGAVISDQIRSIMEAAQAKADDIERAAEDDARNTREEAVQAVTRLLEQIDTIEGHVSGLAENLRREADRLTVAVGRDKR